MDSGCSDQLYLWQAGSATRIQGDRDYGGIYGTWVSNDGVLYAQTAEACNDNTLPAHVSVLSGPGSTLTELLPAPPPTAEVPEWLTGIGSWVVATEQ